MKPTILDKLFTSWHVRPVKNLDIVIIGLCDIVDGLLAVISLGFLLPDTSMYYIIWRTKKWIKAKERMQRED